MAQQIHVEENSQKTRDIISKIKVGLGSAGTGAILAGVISAEGAFGAVASSATAVGMAAAVATLALYHFDKNHSRQ